MNAPKKYQRFNEINPEELFLISGNNRKYICKPCDNHFGFDYLTGPMEATNAQKLIDDYKQYWANNLV